MGISPIWSRLEQSRLVGKAQVQEFREEYQRQQPPTQAITDPHICEWLVQQGVITPYQADVFLAGHHGPFDYDDFRVDDRVTKLPRKGAFRAIHQPTGCRVLLRFHDPRLGHTSWPEVARRVHNVQPLSHRSLTRVFEAVDLEQFRFIVVNDFRGETLADLLQTRKKLSPKRSCRLMLQIASGIGALHRQGSVHGSLRPENILVNEQGEVSVWFDPMQIPHNLAEISHADDATQRHLARYLAPELVDRTRTPDVLSDVYALGCIFYEMLSGHAPYDGATVVDVMTHHATTPMAPLTSLGIPEPLEKVVAFMMAKKAELRYQQADVIAEQVTKILKAAKALPDYQPHVIPAKEATLVQWLQQHHRGAVATSAAQPAASLPSLTSHPISVPDASLVNSSSGVGSPSDVVSASSTPAAAPIIEIRDERLERVKQRGAKRNRAKQKQSPGLNPPLLVAIGAGIALLGILAIGGAWALWGGRDNTDSTADTRQQPAEVDATDPVKAPVVDVTSIPAFDQQVVVDQGKLLWETPTVGPPLALDHMAGGLRVVIAVRPAQLLDLEEGVLLVRSLGDAFGDQLGLLELNVGVQLDQVDQLVMGLHDNGGDQPRPSYRIRLRDGMERNTLVQAWRATLDPDLSKDDLQVYRGPGRFDFLTWSTDAAEPVDDTIDSFLVATREDINGVVQADGAPPLMRQELEKLLRYSDARRHVTIAAIPSALFNDEGRQLFAGSLSHLLAPLERLTGNSIAAAMASFHLEEGLYLEAMLQSTLDVDPYQVSQGFSSHLTELENEYSTFVFTLGSNPYWDRIRMRFANWISLIQANTRVGVENGVVIANCWLPLPAAHNLAAASELSLASVAGGVSHPNTGDPTPAETAPRNIEELLDRPITLSVPRNDLVLIVEELKQTVMAKYPELSFPFDIKMLGNDLQLEGITQNQSVNNFEMKEQPLHAILTALMERAFKAPGVEGPDDPNFMLVWVVGSNPDQPDERIVLITTRVAAKKNNYQLPAAFQPKVE